MVRQVGVDRCLFGSDYPLYSPAEAMEAVQALEFSADEERAILHDNAARLLELNGG